jgi:hypothetical protein
VCSSDLVASSSKHRRTTESSKKDESVPKRSSAKIVTDPGESDQKRRKQDIPRYDANPKAKSQLPMKAKDKAGLPRGAPVPPSKIYPIGKGPPPTNQPVRVTALKGSWAEASGVDRNHFKGYYKKQADTRQSKDSTDVIRRR